MTGLEDVEAMEAEIAALKAQLAVLNAEDQQGGATKKRKLANWRRRILKTSRK